MSEERQNSVISDYFSIPISQLIPSKTISFSLHIYFEQNGHLMLFRRSGDTPDAAFIDRYRSKGITRLWIHHKDRALFFEYLQRNLDLDPLFAVLRGSDQPEKIVCSTDYAERVVIMLNQALTQGIRIEDESISETFIRDWSIEMAGPAKERLSRLWNQSKILKLSHRHSILSTVLSCLCALTTRSLEPDQLPEFVLAILTHDAGRAILPMGSQSDQAILKTLELLAAQPSRFPDFSRRILEQMSKPLSSETLPAAQAARAGHFLAEAIAAKPEKRARSIEEAFIELERRQAHPQGEFIPPLFFTQIKQALIRTTDA